MAFNLADLVEHAVDLVPDRTALICGDRSVTYAELEARSNRLAHHLAANGVGERQHVAIYSYNSIEFVETMLAAYKIRAVPINVNYRYVEEELVYLYDNADVVATVFQAEFCPRVAAVRDRLPMLKHLIVVGDGPCAIDDVVRYEDALAGASPERDFAPRDDGDLYILYTGGTTGFPKGVMWRHEDVFRTLGGGIDFVTGEWVADEYALARAGAGRTPESRARARAADARRRAVDDARRAVPGHVAGPAAEVRCARCVGRGRALPIARTRDHRRRHGPPAHRSPDRRSRDSAQQKTASRSRIRRRRCSR